jgi:hypothetical protein
VVLDPWYALFPTAAALTFAGLAGGIWRKRAALGGMTLDWMVAFIFCAIAFAGLLSAGAQTFSDASDIALAFTGAGACAGLAAAFATLLQRYARGKIGTPEFRWLAFACALGIACLGGGALMASAGSPAKGGPAAWVAAPIAVGAAVLIPIAYLAARRTMPTAGVANTSQLFAGAVLIVAGLLGGALGDLLVGSGLGMTGGALLYSGVSAVVGRAPSPAAPALRPRVAPAGAEAPRRVVEGRKVRVPKGAAMRVTSFRDDEPARDDSK